MVAVLPAVPMVTAPSDVPAALYAVAVHVTVPATFVRVAVKAMVGLVLVDEDESGNAKNWPFALRPHSAHSGRAAQW
jgi:hypothetical protein